MASKRICGVKAGVNFEDTELTIVVTPICDSEQLEGFEKSEKIELLEESIKANIDKIEEFLSSLNKEETSEDWRVQLEDAIDKFNKSGNPVYAVFPPKDGKGSATTYGGKTY